MKEKDSGVCFLRALAAVTAGVTSLITYQSIRDREVDCRGPFETVYHEAMRSFMNYLKSYEDRSQEMCVLINEQIKLRECIMKKREQMCEQKKKLMKDLCELQDKCTKVREKNVEHRKLIKQARNCLCMIAPGSPSSCRGSPDEEFHGETKCLMHGLYQDLMTVQNKAKEMLGSHKQIMLDCGMLDDQCKDAGASQDETTNCEADKNDRLEKELEMKDAEYQKLLRIREEEKNCYNDALTKWQEQIDSLTSENGCLSHKLDKIGKCHDTLCRELKRRLETDKTVDELKKLALSLPSSSEEEDHNFIQECCGQD